MRYCIIARHKITAIEINLPYWGSMGMSPIYPAIFYVAWVSVMQWETSINSDVKIALTVDSHITMMGSYYSNTFESSRSKYWDSIHKSTTVCIVYV